MSKALNEITAKYKPVLSNWPVKVLGPRVTVEQLAAAHALGCRPGMQALAIAMCMREGGASNAQQVTACSLNWGSSGTHHNKRKALVTTKLLANVSMPDNETGHTVYKVALTDKGKGKLATATEPQAVVPKASTKPAKAKKADKPAAVPATVETAPAATAVAAQA